MSVCLFVRVFVCVCVRLCVFVRAPSAEREGWPLRGCVCRRALPSGVRGVHGSGGLTVRHAQAPRRPVDLLVAGGDGVGHDRGEILRPPGPARQVVRRRGAAAVAAADDGVAARAPRALLLARRAERSGVGAAAASLAVVGVVVVVAAPRALLIADEAKVRGGGAALCDRARRVRRCGARRRRPIHGVPRSRFCPCVAVLWLAYAELGARSRPHAALRNARS